MAFGNNLNEERMSDNRPCMSCASHRVPVSVSRAASLEVGEHGNAVLTWPVFPTETFGVGTRRDRLNTLTLTLTLNREAGAVDSTSPQTKCGTGKAEQQPVGRPGAEPGAQRCWPSKDVNGSSPWTSSPDGVSRLRTTASFTFSRTTPHHTPLPARIT